MNATETRTCATHGDFKSEIIWRDSSTGRGYWAGCKECELERAEKEQHRLEEERRRDREHCIKQYLNESGITGRYSAATFGSYQATTKAQRDVLAACQAYAQTFRRDQGAGLFLIGPPGTGKTHLGCAIASEIIRQHVVRAKVASAREIVRRLRATWRKGGQTEEDCIAEFGAAALLVLDEVGIGFGTDGELVQLFDVLDLRYQLKAPTIVLSNLNHPMLREALGDRIYDRLRESAATLTLDWPSHRRPGGAA